MENEHKVEKPIDQTVQKSSQALTEERILAFWEKEGIFKKSLEQISPKGDFVFYDGPPFASGEPHYGHVVPGTIKDIIPRYKTMRGYKVRRRWGWDCHGLPVENLVEKELKLLSKKDIVNYGIGKFNEKARGSVMRYAHDWRKIIPRLGRWVDMEDDYRTMDASYTESVWWAFSELHKKGLIYEDFKVMQLCPRCETTLSNFEVSQGYKDIKDLPVFVKFELVNESNTYILAWTTTPWTLPGNVALAVNPETEYSEWEIADTKVINDVLDLNSTSSVRYILETNLALKLFELDNLTPISKSIPDKDNHKNRTNRYFDVKRRFKGTELIGKAYKPPFDFYQNDLKLKNRENGWKIYGADFVTTESGTGVVHIAPAFGVDDYELLLKHSLPFVQHVNTNGTFKSEVKDFAGEQVKPKDTKEEKEAHLQSDVSIIRYLQNKNLCYAVQKEFRHSYPHCWRCDTPLLNYATSSWFVKVTALRDKLVKENKKVQWVPEEVGEGRFGNWLAGARDWAISRSRFWGAPIPVWKDEKTGECKVIGSVEDLKKYSKPKNTYYICRHGEAESNALSIVSSLESNTHHLTENGKKQARDAGKWFADKKIDIIVSSPFIRTRETAEIIAEKINFDKSKIVFENGFRELNAGIWNNKSFKDFVNSFVYENRFTDAPEGGENYAEIKKRVGDALYGLEEKYEGKNILIVSHDTPLFLLETVCRGLDRKQSIELRGRTDHYTANAKPAQLDFHPLPHNAEYELELHRPFIDDMMLISEKGNRMLRVPEVFDCWFESGSMPFGEAHYPFNKDDFNPKPGPFSKILGKTKGYPADFIAEGLDQTRGWFYSMLVLGVALFGKSPYKKVVVNGLVLAEDGRKMAKRDKNYPDIMLIVNKYGADALRYFLMSSPVVHAQDFAFSERGVDEVVKKHIGRLNNVVSFYEMYAGEKSGVKSEIKKVSTEIKSSHVLDIWIITRLAELAKEVTDSLEKYEIDKASRPFADFIDDLSTWYLRRSRDRFKNEGSDKDAALSTIRSVLIDFVKLLSPFMPFVSEDIYQRLRSAEMKESVHLESWPEIKKFDAKILESMAAARKAASLGLEARMKAKINVRQPLAKLTMQSKIPAELVDLIKDEVNVKEVAIDPAIAHEAALDTVITPELKEEGTVRELIRSIQDLRKEKGLSVKDIVALTLSSGAENISLFKKNENTIMKITGLSGIEYKEMEGETKLEIQN